MQPGNTSVLLPPKPTKPGAVSASNITSSAYLPSPGFYYLCALSSIVADFQNNICIVTKADSIKRSSNTGFLREVETDLAFLAGETNVYINMDIRPPGMGK